MSTGLGPNQIVVDLNNPAPKRESYQTKQALRALVRALPLSEDVDAIINSFLNYIPRVIPDEISVGVGGCIKECHAHLQYKDAGFNIVDLGYECVKGEWKQVKADETLKNDVILSIKCTSKTKLGNPEKWDAHAKYKDGDKTVEADYSFIPGDATAWKISTMSTMADSLSRQVEKEAKKSAKKPAGKKRGRKKKVVKETETPVIAEANAETENGDDDQGQ